MGTDIDDNRQGSCPECGQSMTLLKELMSPIQTNQLNIVGHNGQVLGYTSQFAFEKESKFGVILMRNYTRGATDLDKASFLLLNKLRQLKK